MADPREQEILDRLSQDLQEYLALGSDTPVAPEAQSLLEAIGQATGGGDAGGGLPPEAGGAGGGLDLMAAAGGGMPPEEGANEPAGPEEAEPAAMETGRQSGPANDYRDFGSARKGAMADLKSSGGSLRDLKNKKKTKA